MDSHIAPLAMLKMQRVIGKHTQLAVRSSCFQPGGFKVQILTCHMPHPHAALVCVCRVREAKGHCTACLCLCKLQTANQAAQHTCSCNSSAYIEHDAHVPIMDYGSVFCVWFVLHKPGAHDKPVPPDNQTPTGRILCALAGSFSFNFCGYCFLCKTPVFACSIQCGL